MLICTCGASCREAGSFRLVVLNTAARMQIAWLLPWFRRSSAPETPPKSAAAAGRWPFARRNRQRRSCAQPDSKPSDLDPRAIPVERVTLALRHHVDVNLATPYLLHRLDCDDWHVACRHEHQLVVQLMREGTPRYGVTYDCSPAVEKAVCHGSRAWAMSIIPLHGEANLPAQQVAEIKAGLGELHG